jgi:hypothetical protein
MEGIAEVKEKAKPKKRKTKAKIEADVAAKLTTINRSSLVQPKVITLTSDEWEEMGPTEGA